MGKDSWSGYTNSFSKSFMEILFSYLPFKFWVRFLFPQLLLTPQQLSISCHWLFLTKALRTGFSCRSSSELQSGQLTTMKQGFSRELDNRSNRDSASEWPFFFFFFLRRPSKPCPSSGCKPAGFQGYCRPEQREMGAVQVGTPQTLLNEIQQFFLNKYSSDCWKPLANFKSSEIADFGHLCQCFHCF